MQRDTLQALEANLAALCETVPLGMSDYQILNFVLNHETPARVYRQVALEMRERYAVVKTASFRRRKAEAKRRAAEAKALQGGEDDQLELLAIEREEAEWEIQQEDRLIRDTLHELDVISGALKGLPTYTREAFEAEERDYWEKRLVRHAQRQQLGQGRVDEGVLEALAKIGFNPCDVVRDLSAPPVLPLDSPKEDPCANT